MCRILRITSMGPVKTLSHHRLLLLEQKFNLHVQLNADKEFLAQKSAPHRDFYNVRKVLLGPCTKQWACFRHSAMCGMF